MNPESTLHRPGPQRRRLKLPGEQPALEVHALAQQMVEAGLEGFARAVHMLMLVGQAYRLAIGAEKSELEIVEMLRRPLGRLERAGELFETYGEIDVEEALAVTRLIAARKQLKPLRVMVASENENILIRAVAAPGLFSRTLLEWRQLIETGGPPPVEYVAWFLRGLLGTPLNKHGWFEAGEQLACAFTNQQITVHEAEGIVARHARQQLTPTVAERIAADAVAHVSQRGRILPVLAPGPTGVIPRVSDPE